MVLKPITIKSSKGILLISSLVKKLFRLLSSNHLSAVVVAAALVAIAKHLIDSFSLRFMNTQKLRVATQSYFTQKNQTTLKFNGFLVCGSFVVKL